MPIDWKNRFPMLLGTAGVVTLVTIIILLSTGVIKLKKEDMNPGVKKDNGHPSTPQIPRPPYKHDKTYIKPKERDNSLMNKEPANLCDNKVLYPVQQLKPEYGYEIPDDCPCTQFIRSP